MAELVEHHNKEECQVLEHVPGDGGIASGAVSDFVGRYQEPGPMQKEVDAGKTEEADGSLAGAGHLKRVITRGLGERGMESSASLAST